MEDRNNNKVIDLKTAKTEAERMTHSKFGNYKPDEELLQSTARIKNQRDLIRDRVQKMEIANSRVTRSVYEKVKRDYILQLQTITDLLTEKKDLLRKEIKELYLRREKLTVEINRHREILEEAEFRHFLGEFSESQFHEVEHYETKEIEKLEGDLSHIAQFISSHEELFDPEDLGLPAAQPQQTIQQHPQREVTKTVSQPVQPEPAQTKAQPVQAPIQLKQPVPQKVETAPTIQAKPVVEKEASISQKVNVVSPMDLSSSSIDSNEFEDLFLDDEDAVNVIDKEQSQSNINKILSDDSQTDVKTDATLNESPLAAEEDTSNDYFKQENVSETSFTVKKNQFTEEIGEHDKTPLPSKADEVITSPKITPPKKVLPDDSISDILNSIQIESVEPTKEAVEPISLKREPQAVQGTCILTLIEGDLDTKEFVLKENTSIGRSPTNDIVLKAPKVSRQHAAINMYNNQYIIIDLKSSNGVYVNGSKVDESILSPGDEVSVGGYRFTFSKK